MHLKLTAYRIPAAKLANPDIETHAVFLRGRRIAELQRTGNGFVAIENDGSPLPGGRTVKAALAAIDRVLWARRNKS